MFFSNKKPKSKFTPQVGFEPTTNRLTADRSTTELLKNSKFFNIFKIYKKINFLSTLRYRCGTAKDLKIVTSYIITLMFVCLYLFIYNLNHFDYP